MSSGRFEEAVGDLLAYLRTKPRMDLAISTIEFLVMTYQQLGRHEEAERAYQKAIEMDPWGSDTLHLRKNLDEFMLKSALRRGDKLSREGKHAEAAQAYREALRWSPNNSSAWNDLGVVHHRLGQEKDAEEAYRRALGADPKNEFARENLEIVLLNRAHRRVFSLMEEGRIVEAERAYREILREHPGDAPAWNNLGITLKRRGRTEEAEEVFRKAVELDPKADYARENLENTRRFNESYLRWIDPVYVARKAIDSKVVGAVGGWSASLWSTPQAAWREPLFSKGSPFSAPVDIREKDPRRLLRIDPEKADGLIPGGDLGRFLSGKPWPPAAISDAAAGFQMWERGNFAQARWYLTRASALAPNDKFLQGTLQKLESAQEKARAKLPPRENQAEAAASMVAAADRGAVGDAATALRLVERAAQLWPQNPDIQKSLKRVREVHAARKDLPAPAEAAAQHEQAALWARGQAAFKLGLILAAQAETSGNAEQRHWATVYLAEASFALRGRDLQLIDGIREKIKRGEPLYNAQAVSGNRQGFYPTKADAMLDALEYGKGNWDSSFRYLQHVQQAFPFDRTITAAIAELAAIRKNEDPRVSTK